MPNAVWLAVTKITAPAKRHDVLFRPRLAEAVGHALSRSTLTLISAPAGSGKTTLLAELPGALPHFRFCWLLLDAEDNDPSRFTKALIASLQAAAILPEAEAPAASDPRLLITFLINRITEVPSENCALVLDDLHVITEPLVFDALDYLLEHAPPNLRVIVATRQDPPVSLARRRVRGEVGEIRLDDLNFTTGEAAELASRCLGLSLNPDDLLLLHSRTEGWAAGLRMLATSMSQFPGDKFLLPNRTQGSRQIFDFLTEEVLNRQPPDLRRFLLETSILSRLRAEVCDALTGGRDSHEVLADLYRRNLYVAAADDRGSTFRYHDLFADFLRERLRRERPEDWEALHLAAARAETLPQDRMRHLLAAKAWPEAAREIEAIGPEHNRLGLVASLRRWISELPESVRDQHPRVLYLFGQAVWIHSNFAQAQPYIEKALAAFRQANDHDGQAEATIALANSALMLNELDRCRDLLQEALAFDIPAAGRIQLYTASAWDAIFRKDMDSAARHLDALFSMVESGEGRTNPLSSMAVLFVSGIPAYLARMEAMCRVLRSQLAEVPDFSHAFYYSLHSATLLQRGDFAAAQTAGELSLSIARSCGDITLIQAALCTSFCMSAAARCDWTSILRWAALGRDESRHGQISRAWKSHYLYFEARACWHSADLAGLRQRYEAAMAPNPFEAPPGVVYRYLIQGMSCLAERAFAQAERAFRLAMHEQAGFPITATVCAPRVMLAHLLLDRGRTDEALEVFLPYLEECDQHNQAGRMMFENPLIQPLLWRAVERSVRRPFAERVLAMLGAPLQPVELAGVDALTERELQVLRLMAEGLGNRQIAERLFVSESTIKTHVQRILRKLDAPSRTRAVARARELMLV